MTVKTMQPEQRPIPLARGFTLIELLVSSAIMSIVFLAIGSTILVASRALPNADDPTEATLAASQAVQRLDSEFRFATQIDALSSNAVTFTVADRNGNDTPESILYEWSGTPGDPLTRAMNGGLPEILVRGVRSLSISLDTEVVPGKDKDAGVVSLVSDDAAPNSTFQITDARQLACVINPDLPDDATGWSITSIEIPVQADGLKNGWTAAEIRTVNALGMPTSTVLAKSAIDEKLLGSTTEQVTLTFNGVPEQAPGDALALVLYSESNPPSLRFGYAILGLTASDYDMLSSFNGGASWVVQPTAATTLAVYGEVVGGPPPDVTIARRAQLEIVIGHDDVNPLIASVPLVNQPEAP